MLNKKVLLEQYEELVECDPRRVSYVWKVTLVISYLTASLSSYVCSFLFYYLWDVTCDGYCILWTKVREARTIAIDAASSDSNFEEDYFDIMSYYQHPKYCKWLHFFFIFSCFVSMCLLLMFSICGKGGHDTSTLVSPWRIVIPAWVVNSIMFAITIIIAQLVNEKYKNFITFLYHFSQKKIKNIDHPYAIVLHSAALGCIDDDNEGYNPCKLANTLRISTFTMFVSWTTSFIVLCLRLLTSADFVLLNIKIYSLPDEGPERELILQKARDNRIKYMSKL